MTEKFNLFYYTSKSCDDCCEAFDTADSEMMSDSQRSQKCMTECQCICWPLCITFDLVSCIYRCPKHYIMKCKNTGQNTSPTTVSIVTVQPTQQNK